MKKSAGRKIGRKWVLLELPGLVVHSHYLEVPCSHIEQAYLVVEEKVEIRLRRVGEKHYLAKKIGLGLAREVLEVPIDKEAFVRLVGLRQGEIVDKFRFFFLHDGRSLEFDQFRGHLGGLVMLEVKFKTAAEAQAFFLPPWVLGAREVTDDLCYSNRNLALTGWLA